MDFKFDNFVTPKESLNTEREERILDGKNKIPFGIPFLDQCLKGILKNDLILVGGRSGAGKTEIATHIALSCAEAGKKVAFFALEAEPKEIERRILFKNLAKRFFEDENRKRGVFVNYLDWSLGEQEEAFEKYYDEEVEKIKNIGTLWVRYRQAGSDFTIDNFQREMMSLKGHDLVIVDHFHYFDHDYGNELEIHKRLIKQIRDIAQLYGVPIVLLAHLRKADKKFSCPVPDMEDFQGTSDLYKNATKVIMVGKGNRYEPPGTVSETERQRYKSAYTTYFNIAKLRRDGSRGFYIGKTIFDTAQNSYLDKFQLGSFSGSEWRPINQDETPHWAKDIEHDTAEQTSFEAHKWSGKSKKSAGGYKYE